MSKANRLVRLFLILMLGTPFGVFAQLSGNQDAHSSWQQLQQVIQFVDDNKNDSALFSIEPLWEQLVAEGSIESALGLQVQLARARALEQSYNRAEAILLYNELIAKSKGNQQWNIYAGTSLSLAQLYEKMEREQLSKDQLDLAEAAITQHELDSLELTLFIRRATWNIKFRQHPDSVRYYSQKVLSIVTDTAASNLSLAFSMYLIQGHSMEREAPEEALKWFHKALVVAKSLSDPVRKSEVLNRLTKVYLRFGYDLEKALLYNDSTIQACYEAIVLGHERIYTLHDAYKIRSKLYSIDSEVDSAFHYMERGLRQEIAYIQNLQIERVAEVDARYRDEQKTKQLEEQAATILYEKQIKTLFVVIFAVTLLLAVLLGYSLINRKRAMRKLADQNRLIHLQSEQLKTLDASKSRFFANVSHELRTPLTLVLGPITTALKSGTLDSRNSSLLAMARKNAQSLLELVGSILDLSRMEHGKLTVEEQPERLFQLLRRIVSNFESYAEREGIELTFDYQAEEGLQVQLDRLKLQNILNNLLSNAIKFTPDGGKIKVTIVDRGNAIVLSVEDTGRGIPAHDLPYVFDRFYQSADENAPTEGGAGIGLAYCKELLAAMGGQIRVESQPEKGSTFHVELPRREVLGILEHVEEEYPAEQVAEAPILLSNGEALEEDTRALAESDRPTILVVEDNYSLRDYLAAILESQYKVVTARNGEDALNLLNGTSNAESQISLKPSLIISDVMMPVMDGFQLMEKLKADKRFNHLPLVMLTARADIRDRLKALRIGVDDYLLKPFVEEELLVRVANLLENYVARSEMAREGATSEVEIQAISQPDLQWLETFETYIQQNLSDEMLNIPELASQFAMSESSLLRQLKSLTGLTPAKYVQEMRMDKARQLLEQRKYNAVSEVGREVGYKDSRSFSRSFKKRFGKSPSEYLRTRG